MAISFVIPQVWDIQVDNSIQTVDVIYYVKRRDILLPYEDAAKVMSFVPEDVIHNITGYEIVHKVQRECH